MNIRNLITVIVAALFCNITLLHAENNFACMIQPEQVANVGSQVIGVADKVMVERGDIVKKGQVLAVLKSDLERANIRLAQTRSHLEAEVRSAEASLHLAKLTEKRGAVLVEKNFISKQAYDKSQAESKVAQQQLALAREQLKISNDNLALARTRLNMRIIRSPMSGIVSERLVWPGDRIEEKPLFKIVKTDSLRVSIVVPVNLFGQINKGDFVSVQPDIPNMDKTEAIVELVDRVIDGASNTFRVSAKIENKDLKIPSGLRCRASLPQLDDSTETQENGNAPAIDHKKINTPKVIRDQVKTDYQAHLLTIPKRKLIKQQLAKGYDTQLVKASLKRKAPKFVRHSAQEVSGKIRTVEDVLREQQPEEKPFTLVTSITNKPEKKPLQHQSKIDASLMHFDKTLTQHQSKLHDTPINSHDRHYY